MIETLYVDDDPILLELAKEFLEGENKDLNVTICRDAREVAPMIEKRTYDVIISDYQMPFMSGLDLLKDLRSRGVDVPFILFTGKGREEVAIEALNNGADFYLNKGGNPRVQFTELMNLVRHMVIKNQAIESIKHNAERFREMIENSLDVIGIVNPDDTVRYISPSVRKLLGYDPEEVIGRPLTDLVHPDDRKNLTSGMKKGRKSVSELAEFVFMRKDGEKAIIEGSFSKMREDVGKGFAVFNGREITKNKLMAELLQESEERYRVMFDSSPVGLLFIKGVVKDCNETGADLLGYDRSELMGKSFIDLWNDVQDNGQKAGDAIRGLADVETDAMRTFTWTAKDRTGKKVVFDAQLKNVNFLGERHFLLSFALTRTQVPAAQAASMSEETYKTLLNTTQDSVLVLDKKLKVKFASPRAGDVFGYGKELVGRDILDMADGADKETLSKDLDLLMKGERPQANRYRFIKRNGSTMFSELGSNRIVNEDGSVEGLVCIFHDVSAVVIAEGQAINANRNLSEVTELMRMEIEKRMTVLMAHLQLLQFRYQDDADREEVEMAISSAEEVVKALTIAKSYELMEAEAHQWMSLANVVDAALEGVGTKKLKVSVDMDGYEVFGSAKLGNALGRLFEQSVRKERGSTYLAVRTKEDQGRLIIIMEDDGTPYSANDLERMFESNSVDSYMRTLRFSRDVLRSSGMEITAEKADHGLRFRLQVPPGRFKKND